MPLLVLVAFRIDLWGQQVSAYWLKNCELFTDVEVKSDALQRWGNFCRKLVARTSAYGVGGSRSALRSNNRKAA